MSNNSLVVNQVSIPTPTELIKKIESSQSDDIVISIQTSGSQSQAKTALISRHNIIAHCQSFIQSIPMDKYSTWLNCMPLYHIAGIMIVYRCWYSKAIMILHDNFKEQKIWDDLYHKQITHISLVPRMLLRLLDYQSNLDSTNSQKKLPCSLKYILVGGDSLSEALYQRAINQGWPIIISYGMTEATSTIAIGHDPNQLELLADISARVDDNGALQLKGEMIISQYAEQSSLDKSPRLINLPAVDLQISPPANKIVGEFMFDKGWLNTNDLVQINGNILNVLGRNDHLIIRSGENIQPETIEQLLSKMPGVNDLAITKFRSEITINERGDSIVVLVANKHRKIDIIYIKSWIKENIKTFYQPDYILQVNKIPRTSLGKINRGTLQTFVKQSTNLLL